MSASARSGSTSPTTRKSSTTGRHTACSASAQTSGSGRKPGSQGGLKPLPLGRAIPRRARSVFQELCDPFVRQAGVGGVGGGGGGKVGGWGGWGGGGGEGNPPPFTPPPPPPPPHPFFSPGPAGLRAAPPPPPPAPPPAAPALARAPGS